MVKIVKYKPITVVETFGGEKFYSKEAIGKVSRAVRDNLFVEVEGRVLNVKSIKRIYTDTKNPGDLSTSQIRRLEQRKLEFKQNLGRKPTASEVARMSKKILNS